MPRPSCANVISQKVSENTDLKSRAPAPLKASVTSHLEDRPIHKVEGNWLADERPSNSAPALICGSRPSYWRITRGTLHRPMKPSLNIEKVAFEVGGVATGLFQAWTSDNIHPLTLQACEMIGVPLAMSEKIKLEMERLARPKPNTHVLRYIKLKIGYTPGDAAEYLSRNYGGGN